jgi:uncharacterized protein (TIGR03067 family)
LADKGLAVKAITEFLKTTATTLHERGVSSASLADVADDLRKLAVGLALPPSDFRPAGEDLVYELGEDPHVGIALYLVSDAPGTVSPPHGHLTWAVIAGVRGFEANTLYRITDARRREVEECGDVVVAAGQALAVPEGAIHSTAALGATATYHLHLSGKPLRSLPSLSEQTYVLKRSDAMSRTGAIAKEMEKFQGTWRQIAHERDGLTDPPDERDWEPRTTFTGDTFVVTLADGSTAIKGTFRLDPTREPKAVDYTDTFGPDAGKTSRRSTHWTGTVWCSAPLLMDSRGRRSFEQGRDMTFACTCVRRREAV